MKINSNSYTKVDRNSTAYYTGFFFFFFPLREAWGILVPWAGIKPTALAVEAQFSHWSTREVPQSFSLSSPTTKTIAFQITSIGIILNSKQETVNLYCSVWVCFLSHATHNDTILLRICLKYWLCVMNSNLSTLQCGLISRREQSACNAQNLYQLKIF